ncbi:ribbon-helix-helix domain-containing protein [Asticcacaulis benevestitus]|uniref:ribbon-helix-helix domain-containing protein n=1 Tax=Asticcacaulis benevestitus TaxID=347481 RepID=UPI0009DA95C6|nr:ribbon-helix-helix domain-containing protein [Asticcacaulis benevestitus]
MPGLKKRSLVLGGHATSLAIEPEFWAGMDAIAAKRGTSVTCIVRGIDEIRGASLLASSCRLAVLRYYQGTLEAGLGRRSPKALARRQIGSDTP